jgi:hypothetical protein
MPESYCKNHNNYNIVKILLITMTVPYCKNDNNYNESTLL